MKENENVTEWAALREMRHALDCEFAQWVGEGIGLRWGFLLGFLLGVGLTLVVSRG